MQLRLVMKGSTLAALAAALLMFLPGAAQAQPDFLKDNVAKIIRKAGVHANVSYRNPVDPDVTEGRGYGGSVGLSPGETNGWRYPFALSFFGEDLHSPSGAQFARLGARALLGGIGYGWHFGKLVRAPNYRRATPSIASAAWATCSAPLGSPTGL